MPERFVSEVIRPVVATCDTSHMAVGKPGLPREFVWRGRVFVVAENLNTGAKKYVRNHLQKEKKGEFMGKKYTLENGMELLKEQLPDLANAFGVLRDEVTKDGVLSARMKRMMMVAVSVALRCEPCIRTHIKAAVEMGVSRTEILEATGISILMAGGPAIAYTSTVVLAALDEMGV
jgi:AhpD family alkylhydroperoxidase